MTRGRVFLGVVAFVLAVGVASALGQPDDELLKDEKRFLEQSSKTYTGGQKAAQTSNFAVEGQSDLGGRGFNADVWVHEEYAYVGHWGFQDWANGSKNRFCPQPPKSGVAVVDARDPKDPEVVATLQNPAGTSAEDVVVYTAPYGPSTSRDIAAVGLQTCGSRFAANADRGLQLWDVTNPASPIQIGYFRTACCTRGIHEFEVEHRTDLGRTFAYASVPTSRYPEAGSPSGYRDVAGDGDFRLIDITNPAAPFQVSDFGIQDAGGPFSSGQGCDADPNYGHGVEPSDDGRLVFLSYWDSGFVALDLTDPSNPVFEGRTVSGECGRGRTLVDLRQRQAAALRRRRGLLQDVGAGDGDRLWLPPHLRLLEPRNSGPDRLVPNPKLARPRCPGLGRLHDSQPLRRRDRRLPVVVLGRRPGRRRERPRRAEGGRLLRATRGAEPRQAFAARRPLADAASLGRRRR